MIAFKPSRDLHKMSHAVILWCSKQYGRKTNTSIPAVIFERLTGGSFGEYRGSTNVIAVDLFAHTEITRTTTQINPVELVDTLIHEYQHYLQLWPALREEIIAKGSDDDSHFEDCAIEVAKRDRDCCISYLKLKNIIKL